MHWTIANKCNSDPDIVHACQTNCKKKSCFFRVSKRERKPSDVLILNFLETSRNKRVQMVISFQRFSILGHTANTASDVIVNC